MLVCFYQVLSAHSLPSYALLESPEESLIQEGFEHKIIARTLLALLLGMAFLERTMRRNSPEL